MSEGTQKSLCTDTEHHFLVFSYTYSHFNYLRFYALDFGKETVQRGSTIQDNGVKATNFVVAETSRTESLPASARPKSWNHQCISMASGKGVTNEVMNLA